MSRWALEDALRALLHRRQQHAADQYQHECVLFALGSSGSKPPQYPAILKGNPDGDS